LHRVLVTGGTGFVGRVVCARLAAEGMAVRRVLHRGTSEAISTDADVLVEEIGPSTSWDRALSGVDMVVHLAARVHVMRETAADPVAEFRRVNVQGTENLARAAARAGVSRFVFVSTAKVNGEATRGRPFSERDAPNPQDPYALSKWEAEQMLAKVAAETGLAVTVLRPPLVYGPGVKANFLSLLRAVDSGVPLPLSSISNLRSLVYVGNLVHALSACLTQPAAANRTFFVSDDHDVSTPQLIREIAAALGKKPLLFPFSPALLHGAGLLTGRAEQIARLTGSLQVDVSSIKTALDWQPPFSLQQGLAQTVSWYRARSG
jgi:nucleoside-diphosphate-sugar epimerase